jgi:transposase
MANRRYTDEFKEEAVKQVTSNSYPIKEVASRLGVHPDSLKEWVKIYSNPQSTTKYLASKDLAAENRKLKAELKRVSEERDILKKAAA